MTIGLNAFITAQGKTLISMCNVAVGAITNIILDAVFINVIGMGVKGAALATVISQGVSACFVIRYLTTNKSKLHLHSEIFALMDRLFGLVFCLVLHRH